MSTRTPPLVLGLTLLACFGCNLNQEHELVLGRDGAVRTLCLCCGWRHPDPVTLHEASDWLRGYVVGSA